jgi:hypothetical protein
MAFSGSSSLSVNELATSNPRSGNDSEPSKSVSLSSVRNPVSYDVALRWTSDELILSFPTNDLFKDLTLFVSEIQAFLAS